jgi:hypothetical protein
MAAATGKRHAAGRLRARHAARPPASKKRTPAKEAVPAAATDAAADQRSRKSASNPLSATGTTHVKE